MLENKYLVGYIVFSLFLLTIPCANYLITHVGIICPIKSPCLIPVWFYPLIYAPSGTLFAGIAFVLRDLLQKSLGLKASVIAVLIGTLMSYSFAGKVAIAACLAYFLSELSDTVIYSWLQKYNLILAIFVSASVGLFIDSFVFLSIAFHSYKYLSGLIIGKMLMVCLSIPIIKLSRSYIFDKDDTLIISNFRSKQLGRGKS